MARQGCGLIQVKPSAQPTGYIGNRVHGTNPTAKQSLTGQGIQHRDDSRPR